jgi:hypothetical protein
MTENNLCFTRYTVNPADAELEVSRKSGLHTSSLTHAKLRLRDLVGTHRGGDSPTPSERSGDAVASTNYRFVATRVALGASVGLLACGGCDE